MQFVSLGSPAVLLLLFMLFFATVTARKAFEGGKDMLLITMHNALDALCIIYGMWRQVKNRTISLSELQYILAQGSIAVYICNMQHYALCSLQYKKFAVSSIKFEI